MFDLIALAKKAKLAAATLTSLNDEQRNNTLIKAAELLRKNKEYLIAENAKDIENATANGIRPAMVDRLRLTRERIEGMAEAKRHRSAPGLRPCEKRHPAP